MTDVGYFALLAALIISAYAAIMSIVGVRLGRKALIASGERAALAVGGLLVISSISLIYAFVSRDFSLEYVTNYSNRSLELVYTISGFWAGNNGSLLMWALFLGVFTSIVVLQNQHKNRDLMPYVVTILMVSTWFFISLMIFISNPFIKLPFVPADGKGLNPMLRNPGMYLHPPTTYLGYVGFAIPFAFAMAALISGRLSDVWIRTTRRWALFAWFFLTVGNLVGAWWAYYTLGWGGHWGWDPVENSSFMPWLVGSAYLHSVMIQEKKGMLKVWNMVLIILTFALTILGTLITRSGIINSVHTFSQSGLGPYLFFFFLLTIFGGFGLLLYRLPNLKTENELDSIVSRESAFLFNNLILIGIAFTVLWGTTFPFISEAVRGVKVTVGAPFYNQVSVPLGLILLFLIGFCPLIAWRRASTVNLQKNFLHPLIASFGGLVIFALLGVKNPWVLGTLVLCVFVVATIVIEFVRGTRARHNMTGEDYFTAFVNLIWRNKRRYGGYIIHIGVVLIFIATAGGPFKTEKEATLKPGESMKIKEYTVRYDKPLEYPTRDKFVIASEMTVFVNNKKVGRLTPSKDFYKDQEQPWTRVAVFSNLQEDLYIILSGHDKDGTAGFKIMVNPLMQWLWIAGFVMAFGTIIVIWPDPYEKRRLAMVYAKEAAFSED